MLEMVNPFKKIAVVMFLGTICEHLNKSYGFHHLSAGELLRQEMKREGQIAKE